MMQKTKLLIVLIASLLFVSTLATTASIYNGHITELEEAIIEKDTAIAHQALIIDNLNAQIANQTAKLTENNKTIIDLSAKVATLNNQASAMESQMKSLQSQLTSSSNQINSLSSTITSLQNQAEQLENLLGDSQSDLQTLVFHVCEKDWVTLPNPTSTYNEVLESNSDYDILLLPEYKENTNWTETLSWLSANFGGKQGIPIMLDVFGGGNDTDPIPMLSIANISAARESANIRFLRFAEVISWHMEHGKPFPVDYVISILEFCRANELRLFWTEWKRVVFSEIQSYISGYEEIVTVSFSTNSGDLEPADGFSEISQMFEHWGGSVQSWYWDTRYKQEGEDEMDMPISLLIQHALTSKQLGAEIIQFEPYWYFFDNGEPKEYLKNLMLILT